MDLGELQNVASAAFEKNANMLKQEQSQESERVAARIELKETIQAREETLEGLTSIAERYSDPALGGRICTTVRKSMPIPVGSVEAIKPSSGEAVRRNVYAVVRNNTDPVGIEEDLSVTFSVEAEDGDVENGLLGGTEEIGLTEVDGQPKVLRGQVLAVEQYYNSKLHIPTEDGRTPLVKLDDTMEIETCDKPTADRYSAAIINQLSTMYGTLCLLHAGIEQAQLQPVVTQ